MEFLDYDWDDVAGIFVKENILGSEFSFSTKSDLTISIDYIPKTQARKIATYAKEQLDILKNGVTANNNQQETEIENVLEAVATVDPMVKENNDDIPYAEVISNENNFMPEPIQNQNTNSIDGLSQDVLFEKLQNYKKLLDNGLILQGEYDAFKKEILSRM